MTFPRHRSTLCVLVAVLAGLRLVYVFAATDYPQYVVSDPGHYFARATALAAGSPPQAVDWDVFAMGATVMLAAWWKALALLPGTLLTPLQSALLLNVLASVVQWLCVADIARRLLPPKAAIAVAVGYALWFPAWYLNAFTLSEGPGQLFLVLMWWALLRRSEPGALTARWLMVAGLAWAVSFHARPAVALVLPVAALWVLITPGFAGRRLPSVLALCLPAVAAMAVASSALWWASDGQSAKPSGNNGGMNFFMQQCHVHGAESRQPGSYWIFVPPHVADQPQLGVYASDVPFVQQSRWFAWGLDCLHRQPGAWARALGYGPSMIYGNFFPAWGSAAGFDALMPGFRHATLALVLLCPLGIWQLRRSGQGAGAALLAGSALALWTTFAVFSTDHRHLQTLVPVLMVLAAAGLVALWRLSGRGRTMALVGMALTVVAVTALCTHNGPLDPRSHREWRVPARAAAESLPEGAVWNALPALRFAHSLQLHWPALQHAPALRLQLDNNDHYRLRLLDAEGRAAAEWAVPASAVAGMRTMVWPLPKPVAARGYVALQVQAIAGDGRYSLAGLRPQSR